MPFILPQGKTAEQVLGVVCTGGTYVCADGKREPGETYMVACAMP